MGPSVPPRVPSHAYPLARKKTTPGRGVEGKEDTEMTNIRNRIHALYRVWIVQS